MWTIAKYIAYVILCLSAGTAIASSFVAFITLLGVFPALAEKYKLVKDYFWIEIAILFGAVIGNLVNLYELPIPLGLIGLIIATLFGGIFVGCLSGALAEVLNVFPIVSRRFKLRRYIPYVIMALGFGKLFGSLLQYYVLGQPK
jgi:stage V sporulation protein AB